ncbi:MAG: lipoate--protein ligase family protein [Verrucomicrobia bacterium]|nr:lipoate--protein ligase family protein [Verrucomicrobiota bacterium]MBV8640529.1 lipoate--protein ligase family protein [Verrucomicrobiota bacterium]
MKFEKLRFIHENEPKTAAENMAIDEALLSAADCPVFRSYSWVRRSVSFGYFIPWKVVVSQHAGWDLVRRWTGGGIVEHGEDFTYSLVFPPESGLPTTGELYRTVHLAIENLLKRDGRAVEMALIPDPVRSEACFEKAVEFDLKLQGQKIAGAAIRRNRKGLLLQGSIQRLKVPEYFGAMLVNALGEQVEIYDLSDALMEKAVRIAKEKYGAAEWNCRL